MTEFSLRALVGEVMASSLSADPGLLADEVFAKIPSKYVGEALKETLRGYVRVMVATDRTPGPVTAEEVPREMDARPAGRSWKRKAIADGWRAVMRDRLHVGPDASAWKLLGQCSYDDLMFAAQERRTAAERTLARADHYQELAKLLKDYAVDTVAELPEQVLAACLGDAGSEPK